MASKQSAVAWILAAGLGTRLRPLTEEKPKPLLEVLGRPLLVHALQLLKDAGVRDVAVNSHWLHPQIPQFLGSSIDVDGVTLRVKTTHEPVVMGTGGGLLGLRHVLPAPEGERALIANADALIDLDVNALLRTSPEPLSTLVLKEAADARSYGALGTDASGRIVTFAGRVAPLGPVVRERMFCGWHCVHSRALDVLPAVSVDGDVVTGPESCINKEGYPRWLKDGADLHAFDAEEGGGGFFFDVGTNERLWEANRTLLAGEVELRFLKPFARFVDRGGRVFVHPTATIAGELRGPVVVDEGAVVEAGAVVGPLSVIGKGVRVKSGVRVERAIVQSAAGVVDVDAVSCHVGARCRVSIGA